MNNRYVILLGARHCQAWHACSKVWVTTNKTISGSVYCIFLVSPHCWLIVREDFLGPLVMCRAKRPVLTNKLGVTPEPCIKLLV